MTARRENRRVLVIEPAGNLWGSERALLDLCDGLRCEEWELGICVPPDSPILNALNDRFCAIYPTFIIHLDRKSRISRAIALCNVIKAMWSFKPDVLYVNQAGATKLALMACRFIRRPVISHSRLHQDVEYLRPLLPTSGLHHVICVSNFIRDTFGPPTLAEFAAKISSLYDCYRPRRRCEEVKSRLNDQIICTGRIETNKGQDLLVRALAKARESNPRLCLSLLGEPHPKEYGRQIQDLAEDLNVHDCVRFEGFCADIWPHLDRSDFLICPSHVEALGRVVFEAWDAGSVPIAFEGSGGPSETIKASGAGILYERQCPDCIADAIVQAYGLSSHQRQEMVRRGRDWMQTNIDPHVYAKRVSEVFVTALEDSRSVLAKT